MAKVSDVKNAINRGDKKQALKLLKETLTKNPSAEAWYLAAQLSNDDTKKKQYLQRALKLDKRHVKSLNMLNDLGSTTQQSSDGFLTRAWYFVEDFGQDSRLLGGMGHYQRISIVLSTFVMVIAGFLVILSSIFSGSDASTPPVVERLEAEPLPFNLETDTFINHFESSELTIEQIDQIELSDEEKVLQVEMDNGLGTIVTRTFNITNQYILKIADAEQTHDVTVQFYGSFLEASYHQIVLKGEAEDTSIEYLNNSILIYPQVLNEATAQTLIDVYRDAPTPVNS